MIEEVVRRLNHNFSVKEQFCQAFGLNPRKSFYDVIENIGELFPDTPVRLLRDVCESLQLYDLVELLEKAKPRTLRPALPLEEIEKLRSDSNRPTKFHSKAAVLIIDSNTNASDDTAEKIESFFKHLNPRSEVTTITAGPLAAISNVLRELKETEEYFESGGAEFKEKALNKSLKRLRLSKSSFPWRDEFVDEIALIKERLEELRETKKRWKKEGKAKNEKAMKQKENELQEEKRKLQMTVSPTMEKWIHCEGLLKYIVTDDFSIRCLVPSLFNLIYNTYLVLAFCTLPH